jgi:dephospho-CoA kinase
VWVCTASQEVVKKRLMATRGHSEEEVLKRMAMQFNSLPWATRTFVTEDTVEALHTRVDAAHQEARHLVATA